MNFEFKEINTQSITNINNDFYYFFICNIKDKKLNNIKNNNLLEFILHNNIYESIDNKIYNNTTNFELGNIYQNDNIFLIYTLINGGKPIGKDSLLNRYNLFEEKIIHIIENIIFSDKDKDKDEDINKNIKTFCLDYGNLFVDNCLEIDYEKYKKLFSQLVKKYNINIYIYINQKYKILEKEQTSNININTLIFPYHIIDLDCIYKLTK